MQRQTNVDMQTTKLITWHSKRTRSGLLPVYIQSSYDGQRKFRSTGIWIDESRVQELLPILHNQLLKPIPLDVSLVRVARNYDTKESNRKVILEGIKVFNDFMELTNSSFHHLTLDNLEGFKAWMHSKGNSDSTVANRLRSLRIIYNIGYQRKLTDIESPFIRGLIPNSKPQKKVVEWKIIDNPFFKLQVALGGVDAIDTFEIVKLNPEEGFINYSRVKNRSRGNEQLIYISATAKKLINQISLPESYTAYRSRYNKKLKPFGLSSKSARYMVAQKLQELGCPKDIIALILGHSQNSITDRYIKEPKEEIRKWLIQIQP